MSVPRLLVLADSPFNEWVDSVNGNRGLARYQQSIFADAESIAMFPADCGPARDSDRKVRQRDWAKLVYAADDKETNATNQNDSFDEDSNDDGYPELDGNWRFDVGWFKVYAYKSIPRIYALLTEVGWHDLYVRPPENEEC